MYTRRCTRLLGEALASSSTFAYVSSPRAFSSSATLLKYVKSNRRPRNEEIKIPVVRRVDGTNKLCPPEPLANIIASTNLKTHFVELVQEDPPIVKIIDKDVAHEARKAMKEKQRASKMERKEIQMTWNVGEMDLSHKMKRAREQLEHNNLVDIAFAPKAKQTVPSVQVMKEKMQKIVDALQDIALERRERTLLRSAGIIYLRLDKSKIEEPK